MYDYFGPAWGMKLGPAIVTPCDRLSGDAVCVERVTVDGVPMVDTHSAIATGRVVRMRSTSGSNVAIDIQRAAVGTVEAIDWDAGIVKVLRQRVQLFEGSTWWLGSQFFAVGTRVAVSGFFGPGGEILPTRIENESSGQDSLRGLLVRDEGWWIGDLPIDLTNATLRDFPAGAPLHGDPVLVVGKQQLNEPFAASIVRYTGGDFPSSGATLWQLDGVVTAARGTTDFDVAGLRPLVGNCNCNCNQFTTPITAGTPVTVRGGDGVLSPTIEARPFSLKHRFTGPIDKIDPLAGTVTVLGFTAEMSSNVPIESPDTISAWWRSAGTLQPGDWITLYADDFDSRLRGGGIVRATTDVPAIHTAGAAIRLTDPTIEVLGHSILTDGHTANGYCGDTCGWNSIRSLFTTGIVAYSSVAITLASPSPPLLATRVVVED